MEKSLDKFVPGDKGQVVKVVGEGAIKRRLFDMGITPGTTIFMRKNAPLGDPMEIKLRGYELSVRKAEALSIIMRTEEAN